MKMDRGMHGIHNISNIHVNASFPKNKYRATGNAVTSLYFMKAMQPGNGHSHVHICLYTCTHTTHIHKQDTIFFCKETFFQFSLFVS